MEYLFLSLKESKWKPRQKKWLEVPNGGKATVEQILGSEEMINPKEKDYESQSQEYDQESWSSK